MTLIELNQSISAAEDNGQVRLNRDTLKEARLIDLFSSHFQTEELLISKPKLSNGNGQLTLKGEANILQLEKQKVNIQFTESEEGIQMVLKTKPNKDWKLQDSFPSLNETSFSIPNFSEPRLVLSSFDNEDGDFPYPIDEGLNVAFKVDTEGPLAPMKFLINGSPAPQIQGNIHRDEEGEFFYLISGLKDSFTFGPLELNDIEVEVLGPLQSEFGPSKVVHQQLSATVKLANQVFFLAANFPSSATSIRAQIEPKDLEINSFVILESIIPGFNFKNSIPAELSAFTTFKIAKIEVDLDFKNKTISQASVGIEIPATWEAIPGALSLHKPAIFWNISQPLSNQNRQVQMQISSELNLAGVATTVMMSVPSLEMDAVIPEIDFKQLTQSALKNSPVPDFLPELRFQNLDFGGSPKTGNISFSGQSATIWEIPIGSKSLEIKDLFLEISSDKGQDGKRSVSGSFGGTMDLGKNSFQVNSNFPGEFVLETQIDKIGLSPLLQELGGSEILQGVPIPLSILQAELRDIELSIAPQQKRFQVSATSDLGSVEILIEPKTGGGLGFSMGITPPATWKFSQIDSALSVLDDLNFSGSTLLVSSTNDPALNMNLPALGNEPVKVRKGVNFFAQMDMSGLGVDELMDIKSLQVFAAIGTDPRKMVIEARVPGSFPIQDNISFGDITFRLQPSPTEFSVTLLGTLFAKLGDSSLQFIGGLGIKVVPGAFQANLQATMLGTWSNPFGVEGVDVSDVAAELGIAFPPVRPSVGIAGSLRVGDFTGSVALKFDSANPAKSMLAVAFNRLVLMDVFKTFCPPHVVNTVPNEISQVLNTTQFEDVGIYIVPQPTSIGELQYEQGISLKGKMTIFDLNASAHLKIDQNSGILIDAEMDAINVGDILKITGAGDDPNPSLFLDLRTTSVPEVDITGAIEILGLKREAKVKISDEGFYFLMGGKLFDLFEASIEVEGKDFINGDGISVKATMKNDLFAYLREEATKAIQAAAKEATDELSEAQESLSDAQKEVNRLENSINQMRRTVKRERDRDIKRLQDAQRAVQNEQNKVNGLQRQIDSMRRTVKAERERDARKVNDARRVVSNEQNKVNGLQRQIDSMRRTVRAERERDAKKIRDARNKVSAAQNEVNKIQRNIDSSKARIRRLAADIRAKKRWLDARKWYQKVWAGPEYAAYAAAKTAEQGAIYTKIGGMEAAKHTAIGVLELAKQVLRGLEKAAKTFPIDADPRVAALITAKGAATAALTAAKQTLRLLERAIKSFPIDADPRVAALITAKGAAAGVLEAAKQVVRGLEKAAATFPIDADPRVAALITAKGAAIGVLEAAKLALEGLKATIGGLAEVGEFIVNVGLGGLIDIREASFAGRLSALNGGGVSMHAKLTFMDQPQEVSFSFDFNDPVKGALELANKLIGA